MFYSWGGGRTPGLPTAERASDEYTVTAAVVNETVDRYTDDLLARARDRGERRERALDPLADSPMVGEIRRAGPILGVEFVADRVYGRALVDGVYASPGGGGVDGRRGDHVMLAPPLTVNESAVDRISGAVAGVAAELPGPAAAD